MKTRWSSCFFILLLALCFGVLESKNVFGSAGGDGVDMDLDACTSGTCYNGTVWVHYTYKKKAVTRVGKDWGPFYDNISSALDGSGDTLNGGRSGTSIPTDCYNYGGFWHLEHVMSSIAYKPVSWAFGNSGVGYAYQAAGVRTDVDGPYDFDTAEDMGNDNHPGSEYGQYDKDVVIPHYYSWATMKNVKSIYQSFYDSDPSVVNNIKPSNFFKSSSNYTYFCGAATPPPPPVEPEIPPKPVPEDDPEEPEDNFATAKVSPGADIAFKNPLASQYVLEGSDKYTAKDVGTKTFSTTHSIARTTAQDKKNPPFKVKTSDYKDAAWTGWSSATLITINGLSVGSSSSWAGGDLSTSVSYNDSYQSLCTRTKSWNSYYKVGDEANIIKGTGGTVAQDCLKIRGPRTKRVEITGDVRLRVTDVNGNNGKNCSASNCKYYANWNNLSFKVTGTYTLTRASDGVSVTVPVNFGWQYYGSVMEPSLNRSINLASGDSKSETVSSVYNVSLAYNGKQKVCFNLSYRSSIKFNLTKFSSGSNFNSSTLDWETDSASACVTIYAPRLASATFEMNGLNSAFDSNISGLESVTRSADGMEYIIGKGTGLQSSYSIGQGTFTIKRTDENDEPAEASSQYKTQFLKGVYKLYPTYSLTEKLSSGLLAAGDATPSLLVTGGDSQTISVPIGTEKTSAFSYAYCNYGQYDSAVNYVVYWTRVNGKADDSGNKKTSSALSGGRNYAGRAYKCYALYNPAVEYTAEFAGTSSGIILDNALVTPSISKSSNTMATINNSERLSGDDAGRWRYIFSRLPASTTQVSYGLEFTHTITLKSDPSTLSGVPFWMKNGSSSTYQPVTTNYVIQKSEAGGADGTWTDLSSGTTGTFLNVGDSRNYLNYPSLVFRRNETPAWGIGKYWTYCQRIKYSRYNTFKTNSSGLGVHVTSGTRNYWISAGVLSEDAYSDSACVILKNPEWKERDEDAYHYINSRGYAEAVGANDSGTAEYKTGVQGVVACTAPYAAVSEEACATKGSGTVSGGRNSDGVQYNLLEKNASAYFAHIIRRYDNGKFGSETYAGTWSAMFDESDATEGVNFWKEACLKLSLTQSSCTMFGPNPQKNSMYAYTSRGDDPFSVEMSYKGNLKNGEGGWESASLSPINLNELTPQFAGWKKVPKLSSSGVGTEASWSSKDNLAVSGNAETALSGMTYKKFAMDDLKAGETRLVCNATATKPREWKVKYAKVYRQETYSVDGAGRPVSGKDGEDTFNRYELRASAPEVVNNDDVYNSQGQAFEVGGTSRTGDDCMSLKRDWNYRIESAKLNEAESNGVSTMNAGEMLEGTFDLTVKRDNVADVEVPGDTSGWENVAENADGSGNARNFITDVSAVRTKMSLVLYSLLPFEEIPDANKPADAEAYHNMINTIINGATVKAGSGADEISGENYCKFFRQSEVGGAGAVQECVDVSTVESDAEENKWKVGGSLTGNDWGYSSGTGKSGGKYGLRIDPNNVMHVDRGGGLSGFDNGSNITQRKVTDADEYALEVAIPEMKSFKMTSGAKFCVALAIEKKSSTSTHILISESNCKNVVKNPQFSVWGGDVTSAGGISTTFAKGDGVLNGSWGDFGLIAGGTINAMGSGRGFGEGIGGDESVREKFASVSKMTLSNQASDYGNSNVTGINQNLQADENNGLWGRFKNGGSEERVCHVELTGDTELSSSMVAGYLADASCGLNRLIIRAGGDSTIEISDSLRLGELGLADSGLTKSAEVPQIMIVAKNIVLKEDVEEVDAWLVTEGGGEINTCGYKNKDDGTGTIELGVGLADDNARVLEGKARNLSKKDCWKFLTINGPVVGGKALMRRTQGGDGRDNIDYDDGSTIVNEVSNLDVTTDWISETVDFNPGALLFSVSESSDSAPKVVYTRELAPRY